ncbi:hypothetical protein BC829DRAFT_420997 [Chytridium lagenaria]|nr:hypothetical protein BC829DRAFT_420997 [Chytridium lagenaria]
MSTTSLQTDLPSPTEIVTLPSPTIVASPISSSPSQPSPTPTTPPQPSPYPFSEFTLIPNIITPSTSRPSLPCPISPSSLIDSCYILTSTTIQPILNICLTSPNCIAVTCGSILTPDFTRTTGCDLYVNTTVYITQDPSFSFDSSAYIRNGRELSVKGVSLLPTTRSPYPTSRQITTRGYNDDSYYRSSNVGASLLFMSIIITVSIILFFVVVYCCYRWCLKQRKERYSSGNMMGQNVMVIVQPYSEEVGPPPYLQWDWSNVAQAYKTSLYPIPSLEQTRKKPSQLGVR